ncbi:MAG: hypothetical protein ACXVY8_07250 [Gaiellaceae bacterium]
MDGGDLREIVDRATGPSEEKRGLRSRGYRPSRLLRALIGLALFAAGLSGLTYAVVRLLHIGTCAWGPTPYLIGRQCPSETGTLMGLFAGAAIACLIGAVIAGVGLAFSLGVSFTVLGAAML